MYIHTSNISITEKRLKTKQFGQKFAWPSFNPKNNYNFVNFSKTIIVILISV